MRNKLSSLLLIIGSILVFSVGAIYLQRNNPNRLAFESIDEVIQSNEVVENTDSKPIAILINDLSIKLPLIESSVNDNKWQTTPDGVSYLKSSALPGETGNAIMYGHNWGSILGNLTQAKPGQNIQIIYTDGSVKDFKITYTQEVTPKDVSILKDTKDSRITLYTCSGLFDSKRFVVTAILS